MFAIRSETPFDVPDREVLLDRCFGESRGAKTSERLRENRLPADGLALTLTHRDAFAGTIRLWNVSAGPGRPALLLGPVAVDPALQGVGLGGRLVREALAAAAARGHGAVLLVGDAPYYARFGCAGDVTRDLWLPGPFARERFLGLELTPGALAGARGLVQATGAERPRPDFAALIRAAVEPTVALAA